MIPRQISTRLIRHSTMRTARFLGRTFNLLLPISIVSTSYLSRLITYRQRSQERLTRGSPVALGIGNTLTGTRYEQLFVNFRNSGQFSFLGKALILGKSNSGRGLKVMGGEKLRPAS